MDARRQDMMTSTGLLVLRVGLGLLMAGHGWGKLQMLMQRQFEQFGDPIGLGKHASLILAVFGEFVCPLLVIAGLFTRFAAVPVVITMAVAAFVVHANDPLMMTGAGGSKEPALLFLIPFLTLIFTGGGRFSLDALIRRRKPGA